jgi:heterotetrameric sarcosine oxidase gamma subunit
VSSFRLAPSSSLGSLALPAARNSASAPGVTIAERTGLSLCSMLSRKGSQTQLAGRVRQAFGVELPGKPSHSATRPVAFAWAGPSQWLALGEGINGRAFEFQLRSSLGDVASFMDQSDGRTIIRISGPRARHALAKGVRIDLHPAAFRPGDAAATVVAYVGVHFWQVDAVPTYEFAVFRSFAVSFWDWIATAAAEFGVAVVKA